MSNSLLSPGNPTIFFRFKQKAYSDEFGSVLNRTIPYGLRYGGEIIIANTIKINPFIAIVPSETNPNGLSSRSEYFAIIKTENPIFITSNVLSVAPNNGNIAYVYLEYVYSRDIITSTGYFLHVSSSSPPPNTVILAKIKKSERATSSVFNNYDKIYVVDYSETTYSFIYEHYNSNYSSTVIYKVFQELDTIDLNSNRFLVNKGQVLTSKIHGNFVDITDPEILDKFNNFYEPIPEGIAICAGQILITANSLYYWLSYVYDNFTNLNTYITNSINTNYSTSYPQVLSLDTIHNTYGSLEFFCKACTTNSSDPYYINNTLNIQNSFYDNLKFLEVFLDTTNFSSAATSNQKREALSSIFSLSFFNNSILYIKSIYTDFLFFINAENTNFSYTLKKPIVLPNYLYKIEFGSFEYSVLDPNSNNGVSVRRSFRINKAPCFIL
jgi:hypothetical protein